MTLACTRWLALGAAIALVGCGDDDRPGARDSGPRDTGVVIMDTGPLPDRPLIDTGTMPDRGMPSGMCPAGPCNPEEQTGCMAGEGCYFDGEASSCAPAGPGADGTACNASMLNVCQEGFTCVPGAGDPMMGNCRHLCCNIGSASGCPAGQSCLVEFAGPMGPSGVGYCKLPDACDLVEQTGCAMGEGCYPTNFMEGGVICIEPTGMLAAAGADCTGMASNICVPGTACFGLTMGMMTETRCWKFCNTMTMTGCEAGQTCTGIGAAGFPNLGVCRMM